MPWPSTRIECWKLEDLKADPSKEGVGLPHLGRRADSVAHQKAGVFIEGDPRQQARSLLSTLTDKGLLS